MKIIEPGVYDDLSNEDYHADSALGHSGMIQILKTGLHFRTWQLTSGKTTDAMEFGAAFHTALLEPNKFDEKVTVQPSSIKVRRGEKWEAFKEENQGKIILRKDHKDHGFNILAGMMESVERPQHRTAKIFLQAKSRIIEQSIFWQDQRGFMLKVRPDLQYPEIRIIPDVKSCINADKEAFGKHAANNGYDIQAALYLSGVNQTRDDFIRTFLFICIEKQPPHAISILDAPQEMLDTGRVKIRTALDRYQDYQKLNLWPGYRDGVEPLAWPRWATL